MMLDQSTNTPPRLLIADDDGVYREWLRHHLDIMYPDGVVQAMELQALLPDLERLSERDWDVLLLAACFGVSPEDPRSTGLELLRQLCGRPELPALIAVAQEGNELTAVRAIQLGATDYLPKRLLTSERLKTSTQVALWRIHRRRARTAMSEERRDAAEEAPLDAGMMLVADPGPVSLSPATSSPAPGLPQVIPGFQIRARIGESDSATVYLATSENLPGQDMALKVMKTLRDDADGPPLLGREYAALTSIRSPSVVMIYEYGVHAGTEYLAMEYLPRGDLKARMQPALSEREALHYTRRIAHALHVIHTAGVIHRDLKPPNILLRDDDDVALIDFGISRPAGGVTSASISVVRGSPYYMSPEHALGEPLDARADLYSLGVILYEMLTGKKPYTGSSAIEVLEQHVRAPLPHLPPAFTRYQPLLTRLMAKDREERFATAEEILAALNQVQALDDAQPESSAA